ncbi:MAG: hypothetical protein J5842_07295 [Lachnospiraceae bacterium]|nr:hypothetical protein [Lachnospiraceae bacterium]
MPDGSMDFKYIIQDLSCYYLGARFTYDELCDQEDVPSRLRSAVFRYIENETDLSIRLCDHLAAMDKNSKSAFIFEQLKCEITLLPDPAAGRAKQVAIKATNFFDRIEKEGPFDPQYISEIRFKKKNLIMLRV